jgi:hypothetical protein
LTTGGGDIRVGRGAGRVIAHTGGGDIWIGPIAGSVEAHSGGGDVNVMLRSASGKEQAVQVSSGAGNIQIDLPNDLDARFEIETSYTQGGSFGRTPRIVSAWASIASPSRHGTITRAHRAATCGRRAPWARVGASCASRPSTAMSS